MCGLDNPIFSGWYTDTVDVFRVVSVKKGNVTTQERQPVGAAIPCRVYSSQKNGPNMTDTASKTQSSDKMACDLWVDIQAGDELLITRGGNIGKTGTPERYFAGNPQQYFDPVGGALTGLEHQEIGLLMQNLVGGGA